MSTLPAPTDQAIGVPLQTMSMLLGSAFSFNRILTTSACPFEAASQRALAP